MRAIELLRAAEGRVLRDEDGNEGALKLLPPLSAEEFRDLEGQLPCPLPADARELLSFSRGFGGGQLETVDFSGKTFENGGVWIEEILCSPVPIAHDGFGNYWILDITAESTCWGPILYICHDPAVVVYQCDDVATFVSEPLRFGEPPFKSAINDVHEDLSSRVWSDNPGAMERETALQSADSEIRAFAASLEPGFFVVDLRNARPGDGLSWGRFGPKTPLRRWGNKRLFAYQFRNRWDRLKTFLTGR
jgi:hypothetical protein